MHYGFFLPQIDVEKKAPAFVYLSWGLPDKPGHAACPMKYRLNLPRIPASYRAVAHEEALHKDLMLLIQNANPGAEDTLATLTQTTLCIALRTTERSLGTDNDAGGLLQQWEVDIYKGEQNALHAWIAMLCSSGQ